MKEALPDGANGEISGNGFYLMARWTDKKIKKYLKILLKKIAKTFFRRLGLANQERGQPFLEGLYDSSGCLVPKWEPESLER